MKVKDERIAKITYLAEEMRDVENDIDKLKRQLKTLEEQHNQISAVDLPELMAEIGLRSFTLSDGTKLAIAPVFKISISKPKMDEAYEWLVEHEHDGMVKTRILIPTGVDNDVLKRIIQFATAHVKGDVQTERNIHPQTLGAWGREMEREGMVIPEDIFSIFRSNKTIIE